MSDNYAEETQPLFKLLRTEAFRFVIVRYNHYSFVEQLEKDLKRLFPNRPIKKVDAQKLDYARISNAYFSLKKGFFFIKNFDDVLKEERDSLNVETPQYAAQNERRRHITAGLNLRRDKLAKFPIALFVFVPASTGELYAKIIMEKMPDLWSFRSIILDLEKDITIKPNVIVEGEIERLFRMSDKITNIHPEQTSELNRLLSLLNKTPKNEIAYRLTLFPQISDAAIDSGDYERALSILDEWEDNANESDKGLIWLRKGDVFTIIGNLEEALIHFETALTFFQKKQDKSKIAVCSERLGNSYTALGNLDKALTFYKEYNLLQKELFVTNSINSDFKNGLAISYEKLGSTQMALGNLNKALTFYEYETKLLEELYAAYPEDLGFKLGLGWANQFLSIIHTSLENLDKALSYSEEMNKLFEELHAAYPSSLSFKNGLAISYERLGISHTLLGNLDKALIFYQEGNRLSEELYAEYPTNVFFKNSLAISYEKLGNIQTALGNSGKALTFYQDDAVLFEQLYNEYPTNVSFKNGLAVSYSKLGTLYKDKKNDKVKAHLYFEQCHTLWFELATSFPMYVEFQNNLKWVEGKLGEK